MIMEHWLTKPKYSVGKRGKLAHIDSNDEFNNVKASMAIDDALVSVLTGDALKSSFIGRICTKAKVSTSSLC